MADAKRQLTIQSVHTTTGTGGTNGDRTALNHGNNIMSSSASSIPITSTTTTAPGLTTSQSVPQMSPVPGGRAGRRRMHTTVLEELKNVTSRKTTNTPTMAPAMTPSAGAAPPAPAKMTVSTTHTGFDNNNRRMPSPLNLNALSTGPGHVDASPVLMDPGSQSPATKPKVCGSCARSFTVFRAKHTCKMCQKKVCDECSKNRVKLNRRMERRKGSRLCNACAREYAQSMTPVLAPIDHHQQQQQQVALGLGGGDGGETATAADSKHPSNRSSNRHRLGEEEEPDSEGSSTDLQETGHSNRRAPRPTPSMTTSTTITTPMEMQYLRPRHWHALLGLVCLLVLRLLRIKLVLGLGLGVDAGALSSLFLYGTNWVDTVSSLRVVTLFVVALVAYEEFVARWDSDFHKTKPLAFTLTSCRPSPPPVTILRKRNRTRTRSAVFSESSSTVRSTATATSTTPGAPGSHRRERDTTEEDVDVVVEVGDKHTADTVGFSFDKFATALAACTTTSTDQQQRVLQMSAFLVACESICGFILVFGRATSFAASTVTGYISTISTNLAAWPTPTNSITTTTTGSSNTSPLPFSWKEQSVRVIVEREVELQQASVGGKKKPSCARCVLRLVWFIEFVEACLRYTLLENKEENCSAGASKAYEETIGARHPWIIRKGVNSALSALPTRSAILESLKLHQYPPEEAMALLKQAQTNMKTMLQDIQALLKEHTLMDIK